MAGELDKRARERGSDLNIEQIKQTTDKLARIQVLQPFVKNGTIQFSRRHHTLLEQMKFFPKGNHDDGLDALEMVYRLCKEGGQINYSEILEAMQKSPNMESYDAWWPGMVDKPVNGDW